MCIIITAKTIRSFDLTELGKLTYELFGQGAWGHLERRSSPNPMDTPGQNDFFPRSSKYPR